MHERKPRSTSRRRRGAAPEDPTVGPAVVDRYTIHGVEHVVTASGGGPCTRIDAARWQAALRRIQAIEGIVADAFAAYLDTHGIPPEEAARHRAPWLAQTFSDGAGERLDIWEMPMAQALRNWPKVVR